MSLSAANNTTKYEDLEGSVCSQLGMASFASRVAIQIQNKQVQQWLNSVATSALSELVSEVLVNRYYITYKMSHYNCHPPNPQRNNMEGSRQEEQNSH